MSDDVNYINLERLRTFLQEVKRLIPTNYATKTELNNYFPKSGGALTGRLIHRSVNDDFLAIGGGATDGSFLVLYGKDSTDGAFELRANNGSVTKYFIGQVDGTLAWDGKNIDVIEEQGDGYIRYSNGLQICWGSGYAENSGPGATNVFPKPFIDNSYTLSIAPGQFAYFSLGTKTASSFVVYASADTPALDYIAIGRWK